jgi:hypothetical protein
MPCYQPSLEKRARAGAPRERSRGGIPGRHDVVHGGQTQRSGKDRATGVDSKQRVGNFDGARDGRGARASGKRDEAPEYLVAGKGSAPVGYRD